MDQIEVGVAGGAAARGTLRGPEQRNRSATSDERYNIDTLEYRYFWTDTSIFCIDTFIPDIW